MLHVEIKISPTTIIKCEAETTRELVAQVAHLSEVFQFSKCGICGAPVTAQHREPTPFLPSPATSP